MKVDPVILEVGRQGGHVRFNRADESIRCRLSMNSWEAEGKGESVSVALQRALDERTKQVDELQQEIQALQKLGLEK